MGRRKNNATEFQEEKRQLKELQKEMEDLKKEKEKTYKKKNGPPPPKEGQKQIKENIRQICVEEFGKIKANIIDEIKALLKKEKENNDKQFNQIKEELKKINERLRNAKMKLIK